VTRRDDNDDREPFIAYRRLGLRTARESYILALSSGINILAAGSSAPLITERKGTDPHWKHGASI